MNNQRKAPITELELASMRSNLNLLRSQVKTQRVDNAFLGKQVDKLINLLERIDMQQKQQNRVGRLEALYNVSRVLGSSLELQTVLNQVMDSIIQLTGAERGFLMLRDDDGGLTVKAARNLDQETLADEDFKYSRTVTNQVLDTGLPILTTNAAEDPRFSGQASIVAQSLRSIMATPLRARGAVIGVVYVDSRALAGLFHDEDLDAMDAFSGQAAIALDNALLFDATDQELAQRIEELRQLRRIDLLLNETLDVNKALAYTLEWACRLARATSGHLGLIANDTGRVEAVQHFGLLDSEFRPEYLDTFFPQVKEIIDTGKTVTVIMGQDSPQTVLMMPIRREQDIIGVVILKRIPAREFTDEEKDLVARVTARAAITIENANLYSAVQAADKAKSEFVGIVAHDLKAPMNNISGYAQLMLMDGELDDEQELYINRIRDTVQRMEILVSDLADISRIESGHFLMEETIVPVNMVIEAVKSGTMPEIQARGHTLIENIADNLPDMRVDYYRLLQVLNNLVSNAFKYTPDGGKIRLNAERDANRIIFSVEDTGIGMSEDELKMLGTKFWRAEDRYTRSQPGTGLGFSITRQLVEQMGSKLTVESERGKGSKFMFSVAIAEQEID
ncbi:MAG: GAF domain-containing sensor histidine kinase [Aggregatilineales bacterium]